MFGNHTRQTAIIRLTQAVVWLVLLSLPRDASAQPAPEPAAVACVTCIAFQVSNEDAATLAELPSGALEGLTVAIDPAVSRFVLDRLAAAGATPALVVKGSDPLPVELVEHAPLLIVADPGAGDEAVFALRTLATAARAARPDLRILIDAPAVPDPLAAYVDGRVQRGPDLVAPDVQQLVSASLHGSADLLLVRAEHVDPRALAAFIARRAFGSEVVARAPLSVAEIVARHQAQRRRQQELLQRWIATGTTTLMFEVPGFVAPVTVTADTRVYVAPGTTEMEQRDIRVNGAAIAGGDASSPPELPLIEAERVATPPLTITLNERYRYELTGRAAVTGGEAYVVTFDGADAHGRAWIDTTTFALHRLETIQAGLRGAIVSSEQHEEFQAFDLQGEQVSLPVRTAVFQMYEGAGHRTPIHRAIETRSYELNPQDFTARLEAAHASSNLMLRETPQGFRYLLRDRNAPETGERVVAPRAGERIRTAVFGVLVDPNISTPLPFAGVSYVDLNLFDTGTQLNAFFGGSYGQLSWSVPSLGGTRWQAHGTAFAIAVRYNDRSFRGGVEQYAENITQRPAHVAAGLVRPLSARLRARIDYELDYTAFDRADTTAATFVVPANAIVHGLVTSIEAESGAWSARAWFNPAVRQGWSPWGDARQPDAISSEKSFVRFGTVVARTVALGRTLGSRVEVAWMDGVDLDRFSRYSFGAFENRLHGYPTASVRYDRGGVVRSVTNWSARGWRVDAFGDMAVVRDPGFGDAFRGYPGIGAAIEAAGPLRTLWSVEWGYGFKARTSDGGTGTQSLRVTAYRNF